MTSFRLPDKIDDDFDADSMFVMRLERTFALPNGDTRAIWNVRGKKSYTDYRLVDGAVKTVGQGEGEGSLDVV